MRAEARTTIGRLLIANRGELVVRIARTCREIGTASIALVAADQTGAWWTRQTDERAPLEGSYLEPDAVLRAARDAAADAIHPGYGFLAEDADFAAAVEAAGLRWVGPPPDAMRRLGDKAAARQLAAGLGIAILPGYDGSDQADRRLAQEAAAIGYPVLLKPSAGGGGMGMHAVHSADELGPALQRARREARAAFGDDRIVLERYAERPRHIEIQLLLDQHGGALQLGERDCTLQRRHQKVIEEAPSPSVDAALRDSLGAAALRLAIAAGYVGAGTAEFLLDEDGQAYFLELNARLQVEHPVTELVTGRDLVADQLRVAAGGRLRADGRAVEPLGHAIEARLYAEDPWSDFLPAVGRVGEVTWPAGEGIRIDAGVGPGDEIGTRYDPLLAKVIAHGRRREDALDRLTGALDELRVEGVTTNRGFLLALLRTGEVRAAQHRTDTIARVWRPGAFAIPDEAWSKAALRLAGALSARGRGPVGFRLNEIAALRVEAAGEERLLALHGTVPRQASGESDGVTLDIDGRATSFRAAAAPSVDAAIARAATHDAGAGQAVEAPMPGTVLDVRVVPGSHVAVRDVLVVLEAMKMENPVIAPADGRVERVLVRVGQTVQRGDPLVELA